MNGRGRLRVAWFSHLNCGSVEGPSKSAYTSDLLLPVLRDRFEIELFHDSFDSYQDYPTFHYLTAVERDRAKPFDLWFYQLEDGLVGNFVRMHLGLKPGLVLFHDYVLASDGPEPILNSPWENVLNKFHSPAASWPERGAEFNRRGPQAFREASLAAVPLFVSAVQHGDYQREIDASLGRQMVGYGSYYLPAPVARRFTYPAHPAQRRIGYLGSPRIEHRAHKLLAALAELDGWKLSWLLDPSEQKIAEELIREFELNLEQVEFHNGRTPAAWQDLLSQVDIAIHTSFSVYDQPSPYLAMSLMAGRPAIAIDFASIESLPDSVVFKIEPGPRETVQMRLVLDELFKQPQFNAAKLVQTYAQEFHDFRLVAAELAAVFEISKSLLASISERWQALEHEAWQTLLTEAPCYCGLNEQGPESDPIAVHGWDRLLGQAFREIGWGQK